VIILKPTTIRLGVITYEMRAGMPVPAPVLTYWRGTGELARLQTSGAVSDEAEKTQAGPVEQIEEAPAPRKRGDR
jgi:hypothetical protein